MSTKGLNILFTTAHFPYPLIGGDRIKSYNIIKHLAKKNKVYLVSFDRGLEIKEDYINELRKINVESFAFQINKAKAYLSAGFFSPLGKPLEINYFRNGKFGKKVEQITSENRIDLVISFFLRTAEYVKNFNCKKILLAEDCRTLYQGRTYQATKNLREKTIRFYETHKMKKYEAGITRFFDITTLVTNEDVKIMKSLNPKADIRLLTNGVDTDKYVPSTEKNLKSTLLFTGKLDFWVNVLMVKKIVNDIFPGIKKKNPDARLIIAGANPHKEILKCKSESIEIHSNVKDIIPYYQNASVFLHPHEGGSGIQNKIMEAMACGCSVVTTKSGARGIDIQNGANGFIANNNNDFIQYANTLLEDENLRAHIGSNARAYVKANHTWEAVFSVLDEIIEELIKN